MDVFAFFTPGVVVSILITMGLGMIFFFLFISCNLIGWVAKICGFIGALWYGPFFGDLWLMGHGLDVDKDADKIEAMRQSAGPAMVSSIFFLFSVFFFLYFLLVWVV